nr:methyltransferase domain-containing protein [Caballeronia sp. TF1N1]
MRSYDPFGEASDHTSLIDRYGVVLAFEVFEHHVEPLRLVETLASLIEGNGAMLISTLFVPQSNLRDDIGQWWYCMPRNGHVSFYTASALALLALVNGLEAATFSEGLHLLYRGEFPDWARHVNHTLLP